MLKGTGKVSLPFCHYLVKKNRPISSSSNEEKGRWWQLQRSKVWLLVTNHRLVVYVYTEGEGILALLVHTRKDGLQTIRK